MISIYRKYEDRAKTVVLNDAGVGLLDTVLTYATRANDTPEVRRCRIAATFRLTYMQEIKRFYRVNLANLPEPYPLLDTGK